MAVCRSGWMTSFEAGRDSDNRDVRSEEIFPTRTIFQFFLICSPILSMVASEASSLPVLTTTRWKTGDVALAVSAASEGFPAEGVLFQYQPLYISVILQRRNVCLMLAL